MPAGLGSLICGAEGMFKLSNMRALVVCWGWCSASVSEPTKMGSAERLYWLENRGANHKNMFSRKKFCPTMQPSNGQHVVGDDLKVYMLGYHTVTLGRRAIQKVPPPRPPQTPKPCANPPPPLLANTAEKKLHNVTIFPYTRLPQK